MVVCSSFPVHMLLPYTINTEALPRHKGLALKMAKERWHFINLCMGTNGHRCANLLLHGLTGPYGYMVRCV